MVASMIHLHVKEAVESETSPMTIIIAGVNLRSPHFPHNIRLHTRKGSCPWKTAIPRTVCIHTGK